MILNYPTLKQHIVDINNTISAGVQIQKIYSSYGLVSLQLRDKGKTIFIYLGRGSGFEGVWQDEVQIESQFRLKDRLLEYFRSHVRGGVWQCLEIDTDDRCFSIVFIKKGKIEKFSIFYCGRRMMFVHRFYSEKKKTYLHYKSWDSQYVESVQENVFNLFNEVGRKKIDTNGVLKDSSLEQVKAMEKEQYKGSSGMKRAVSKVQRTISKIEIDIANAKSSDELYKIADSGELESMDGKIKINGIRFNFTGCDYYEKRNKVFEKAKKLKKVIPFLEERLKNFEKKLEAGGMDLNIEIRPAAPYWRTQKKKVLSNSTENYKIINYEGIQFGVGTNASSNDQLRKIWARPTDTWFHLDQNKSAHIIVKDYKPDYLSIVAYLMKKYSKVESNEVDLIYTEVKNLKGLKGVAGSVNYKKEKHIRVILSDEEINNFNKLIE
jgi:predicted ribosome quality control (RQC) complex YloA/Tae2 family protein